jgi:hypothetical protein
MLSRKVATVNMQSAVCSSIDTIDAASLAPNHDCQAAHYSRPTPPAIYVVMSDIVKDDVTKATEAVRRTYNELLTLQTNRRSAIPLPLLLAGAALERLSCDLNLLAGSPDALTHFCAITLRASNVTTNTWLSDALVQDIEAIARHFRCMTPMDGAEIITTFNKSECQNIAEMVDRYDRAIFSALIQRDECVHDKSSCFVSC